MVELGSFIGQVKWFNGNKGYGFITCLENRSDSEDSHVGKEVFVHHTSVCPASDTYRTLFKGEYVQFSMGNKDDKPDEPMAVGVQGILGNSLQCDVHAEERKARAEYAANNPDSGQGRGGGGRGGGGRGGGGRGGGGRGGRGRGMLVKEGDQVPDGYMLAVPNQDE